MPYSIFCHASKVIIRVYGVENGISDRFCAILDEARQHVDMMLSASLRCTYKLHAHQRSGRARADDGAIIASRIREFACSTDASRSAGVHGHPLIAATAPKREQPRNRT